LVEDVRLGYRGAEGLSVGPGGAAGADLPGVLKDAAPVSYQWVTDGQLIESSSIKGATIPDGQTLKSYDNPDRPTFEEWLKSKGRESDGQNSGAP
jgi:hypothetical protein